MGIADQLRVHDVRHGDNRGATHATSHCQSIPVDRGNVQVLASLLDEQDNPRDIVAPIHDYDRRGDAAADDSLTASLVNVLKPVEHRITRAGLLHPTR